CGGKWRKLSAHSGTEVAEREGFEPSRRFPAYTLSRRAPSTTRPSLRMRVLDYPGFPSMPRGHGTIFDERAPKACRCCRLGKRLATYRGANGVLEHFQQSGDPILRFGNVMNQVFSAPVLVPSKWELL